MTMEKTELNYEKFLLLARSSLLAYFDRNKKNPNYSLKDIYPVIFDNIKAQDAIALKNVDDNLTSNISNLYESSFSKEERKDYGQFYTNDSRIIKMMLSDVDLLKGKILEPSCGSGLFLSEIAKEMHRILKNKGMSPSAIFEYLLNNLYGNDVDKVACEVAEINLLASLMPLFIELSEQNNYHNKKRFCFYNEDFIEKNIFNGFDLIIGNPPFVTLYGKRSRNMNEEKRAFYNTFDFVINKKGNNKFNVSMFFIENSLKALNSYGCMYFVLDISFFETAFIDLRKYLLENYQISKIVTGLSEFEGVASGQLLLKLLKNRKPDNYCEWVDYDSGESILINQDTWLLDSPKYRIVRPSNGIERSIIDKIEKGKPLSFYYPNKCLRTCCALTGKTEEFIVDPNKEKLHTVFPYLEGSKGLQCKFGALTAERYIKYDYELQIKLSDEFKAELEVLGVKNKKRVTLGDKEMYLSPKLFIRQSAFELIASYTDKPYAANNSLYVLSKKSTAKEDIEMLKYTCGILNSDLMTFYALTKKIIRADKGKTPQIKTSDLKEVRIIMDERFDSVVNLVNKLLINQNKKELRELNDLIYNIYSLTQEEIAFIEDYLASK